jgi:DNA polymerase-3 subunit delta
MSRGKCLAFLGPEIGEKQDAIGDIRRSMQKQYGAAPEETSFYAGETSVSEMVSVLRNSSLFSDTRLIFIKNAEVLKKKDEIELLSSYMNAPQDDTTLILLSDEIGIDKGLEKTLRKDDKRIFWELFENKKTEWVTNFFRREGYRITAEGIEAVLELVENNTDSLRRECSRLMLFVGKDKPVGEADVEQWLSHTREESAFTLFSRVAEGDFSRALEILHTLLGAKEKSRAILAALASCFRKLRDFIALSSAGVMDDFEYKKIGLGSNKLRREYAAAGQRYSMDAADNCLACTAETDLLLNFMNAGLELEAVLMDVYLYKIISLYARA